MAIVVKDRVQQTSTTTGTSDFVLSGAVPGYQTFDAIGNNTTYYCAVDPNTGEWEVGIGTYTVSTTTLTRTTILSSSAGGSKITFADGTKSVFCTYPAEKAIYEEPNGNTLIDGGPLTVIGAGVAPGYTTFSAALAEMYGDVNSFAQSYARNLNDGSEASADMIVYRDNTVTDGANFMDMGINSSNFSSATWPIFTPSSMYLYGDGGEMFVGSGTDDLIFFTGGVDATDEAARFDKTTKELTTQASVNVTGDINAQGGTFTAPVTTSSTSTPANNEFVTKAYVDNASSTGIHIHTPCTAETSSDLSATAGYTQGGTLFDITDITGGNTVVTSVAHGLSVNDQIWLYSTAGNGLSTNTAYFVYATPTTTSLQLSTTYGGTLLTGLTNASGLTYATRANSGVGAYWESTGNATFSIPGVSLTVGDRILVYQQLTSAYNGVYTITSLGSGASKWKLTRATDANKFEPANTDGLGEGDYFFIESNSESYVLTTPGNIIIGYTGLTYTLFSSVPAYVVNSPLELVGNELSLTTVPATLGGTGQSTVTTGDLLYGSAADTWSKLPAGSAYRALVMNGSGTNVEWNAIALNQANAVSGALGATNGGTGQSSYTTGDILYSSASNTLSKLAGNTSTTKKFLNQTGTGSASAAPSWDAVSASDVSGLGTMATQNANNVAITGGTINGTVIGGSTPAAGTFTTATATTVTGTTSVVAGNGVFINSSSVTTDLTIDTGQNGFSIGPLTVASGVTLTVASGQRHVVI